MELVRRNILSILKTTLWSFIDLFEGINKFAKAKEYFNLRRNRDTDVFEIVRIFPLILVIDIRIETGRDGSGRVGSGRLV